ncbi:hypothetical protein [Methylobacterium sp. ID0610]|uniref:hypothetical protein n=1 Tax=Methylobacterium carpenticola TaxID=3344827 RepID=UPI0036BC1421
MLPYEHTLTSDAQPVKIAPREKGVPFTAEVPSCFEAAPLTRASLKFPLGRLGASQRQTVIAQIDFYTNETAIISTPKGGGDRSECST